MACFDQRLCLKMDPRPSETATFIPQCSLVFILGCCKILGGQSDCLVHRLPICTSCVGNRNFTALSCLAKGRTCSYLRVSCSFWNAPRFLEGTYQSLIEYRSDWKSDLLVSPKQQRNRSLHSLLLVLLSPYPPFRPSGFRKTVLCPSAILQIPGPNKPFFHSIFPPWNHATK